MQIESLSILIKSLQESVDRLKKENDTLRTQNSDLKKTSLSDRENDKDIIEFLKIQITNKQKEIVDYETRLRSCSHESDVALADLQTQLHVQKDVSNQTIQDLQSDISRLRHDLDELSDFKSKKGDIEKEIAELKLARKNDKVEHKERQHEMEREVLREKDKLLKEKEQQVKEIRENILNLSKANLDKTTKLTIMENDQITSELAFQAKQTMEVVEQNKKLTTENIDLKRTMELMGQTEKELSKKNTAHHKTIKSLQGKIQELEEEVNEMKTRLTQESSTLMNERRARDDLVKLMEFNTSELEAKKVAHKEAKAREEEAKEEKERIKTTQAEILVAVRAAFDRSRQSAIDSFMRAETDVRLNNGYNIYELSESVENILISEKDNIMNFISEKINPKESNTALLPHIPIRSLSAKADILKPTSPTTPTWDSNTGKIYMGFSAPLPPNIKTKRQLNKGETKNAPQTNKELISIGVQTDSAEKNIFMMEKWMKENNSKPSKLTTPTRITTSRLSPN